MEVNKSSLLHVEAEALGLQDADKIGLSSEDEVEPQLPRQSHLAFTKTVNRGALVLKERAAVRKLQQAEERLKVCEQKSSRALRALGRKSNRSTDQPAILSVESLDSEVTACLAISAVTQSFPSRLKGFSYVFAVCNAVRSLPN